MPTNPVKRYTIMIYLNTQSLLHVLVNIYQLHGDDNTKEFTYFVCIYIYIYIYN